MESLSYLGLSTVVIRSQPQAGTELTYVKLTGESNGDAGDQYTGLDRFGRVVDQRWIITATGTPTYRMQYGYDRDGNVLYANNLVNSSFSELYHANGSGNGYDQLNQLTNFARGTLNGSNDTISSPSHNQLWAFDALGNWSSVTTDGSTQTRTANQQNEITSISGLTTPGYDANGNTTTGQNGNTLIFDAWNRLVQVKNGSNVLEAYSYDGLNRRITENPGTVRDLYYSMLWQLLEEDVGGSMQDQYVWSPVYVDALIERDTPTLRMYAQHDLDFNVSALVDTSGNVQERYVYDPYGSVTILAPNWTTRGSSNYGWVYFHQGGRFDFATGLYAFRHRDYSALLGRWLENDPIGFLGRDDNLYRYEADDPVSHLDPSGNLCQITIHCRPTESPSSNPIDTKPLYVPHPQLVHCGLTITDDSGTYQIDGSGGGTNTIIIRPGPGWNQPDDFKPKPPKPEEIGPFNPWGQGGTVFGQPVSHPDEDCKCLRTYYQTFNPLQIPRGDRECNSNWTLYCMLNHCKLADNTTWSQGPPIGYGPKGCCKDWIYAYSYSPEGMPSCTPICQKYRQCPP